MEARRLDRQQALQIVRYYTCRNYIAYLADRKKRLSRLNR
jgi:hypothetical protein